MDGTKAKWIVDDQRLLRLVYNTFIIEVENNTIYYQIIKQLWESIESLYFGRDNLPQIYNFTLSLLQIDVNGKTLSKKYTNCHHRFQQWSTLLSIINNVNVMHSQCEQFGVMYFLISLP